MKELDPLLHNQLRLSIMALLTQHESITFSFIADKTGASRGNISVQLSNLEEAGYITINKSFVDKKPQTSASITQKGERAMEEYTNALKSYLDL